MLEKLSAQAQSYRAYMKALASTRADVSVQAGCI